MENSIEIKINKTTEEIKKISLPCYLKSPAHYFKVFSKEECVCVTDMGKDGKNQIGVFHVGLAFNSDNKEISEEEFNEAFKRISLQLIKIKDGLNSGKKISEI